MSQRVASRRGDRVKEVYDLNYTTYDAPLTKEDWARYGSWVKESQESERQLYREEISMMGFSIGMGVFFGVLFALIGAAWLGLVIGLLCGAVVVKVILQLRRRRVARVSMLRFAHDNSLEYSSLAPAHMREDLRFTDGTTVSNYGQVTIPLKKAMPHIVLDAKGNNGFFGATSLPEGFDKSQVISLEGDFDKYFTLYGPEGYQTDVRYILTPDVMQVLIDHARGRDVVIRGSTLELSLGVINFASAQSVRDALAVVTVLRREIAKQADAYRDDKAPAADGGQQVVAEAGRVLMSDVKRQRSKTIIYVAIAVIVAIVQAVVVFGVINKE